MRQRLKTTLILSALIACFTGGLACDEDGDEGEREGGELAAVQCDAVEVPRFEDMTAWSSCVGCHSSRLSGAARQGAPRDFNYDSLDEALFDPFETAEVVQEGSMPPSGALSAADIELIGAWAQCGTP